MSIRVPILTYHSIDKTGSIISTSPDKFRSQMQHLRNKRFNIISLNDIVTHIREDSTLPSRSVAITFDDGFKNFYAVAYPILKEYGFSATIFLVPGYCGKNNQWDGQPNEIPILDLLDWNEIGEMANNGIEFGAHTMHHSDLSKLSIDQAHQEIVDSKLVIQRHIEKDVFFFAYPYGIMTEKIRRIAIKQYFGACSTQLGLVSQQSDIYCLPRIDMYYFSKNHFFKQLGTSNFSIYINIRNLFRSFKNKRVSL